MEFSSTADNYFFRLQISITDKADDDPFLSHAVWDWNRLGFRGTKLQSYLLVSYKYSNQTTNLVLPGKCHTAVPETNERAHLISLSPPQKNFPIIPPKHYLLKLLFRFAPLYFFFGATLASSPLSLRRPTGAPSPLSPAKLPLRDCFRARATCPFPHFAAPDWSHLNLFRVFARLTRDGGKLLN